jgi:DNA-binding CsgD family transcriptional regulator
MAAGGPRAAVPADVEGELDAEQFRLLAESLTSQVFVVVAPDWSRILWVNPHVAPLAERTVERYGSGREGLLEAVHEEDRVLIRGEGEACRQGEREFEFRLRDLDGHVRWFRCRGFPIRDASGTVRRLGFVLEDRTVQRQAGVLLDEVRRHVTALVRAAGDPSGVLRRALGLEAPLSPPAATRQSPRPLRPAGAGFAERAASLTPRERQVMDLLVTGMPTKRVAAALGLSRKTVEGYHTQVLRKMQVSSVAELVRLTLLAERRAARGG